MVKLTSGMQFGVDELDTGNVQGGMLVHRDAPAIVPYAGGAVIVQCDSYFSGKIVCSLVNRIVNNLPQQVMQPA